ncbi:hypothetical protein K488DRAFT_54204, partial [Vararia minispora EC-137]
FLLGVLMAILGAHIRRLCYRELGALFTYELTVRDNHKLLTTGPYSVVRHPSYTGAALLFVGVTACAVAPGSWVVESCILDTMPGGVLAMLWVVILFLLPVVMARAPKEDAQLHEVFGEEWEAYARRVRWMFVPGVL